MANPTAKEDLILAQNCLGILSKQPFFQKLADNSHSVKHHKRKRKLSSFEQILLSCSDNGDKDTDSQTT